MKMPKEIRDRWTAALLRYRQARGVLRHGDTFCCLGVLCDIQRPERWYEEKHDAKAGLPSLRMITEFGSDDFEIETFANLNDKLRWGFPQIRELIERDPERAELQALQQIGANIDSTAPGLDPYIVTDRNHEWEVWNCSVRRTL